MLPGILNVILLARNNWSCKTTVCKNIKNERHCWLMWFEVPGPTMNAIYLFEYLYVENC